MVSEDGLLPADIEPHLQTREFGRRLYYLPEVDSTNRLAREMVDQGARHGAIVVADYQQQGRGRHGRVWSSPRGRNLLFSIILRPDMAASDVLPVTLAFSLAIADVLDKRCGCDTRVKWPNDVMMDGGKICGILSESSSLAGRASWVIVGIGVNVNITADEFPPDMPVPGRSCYTALHRQTPRAPLLAKLLQSLEREYARFSADGFGPVRERYCERLATRDGVITFERRGKAMRGVVLGIEVDGALTVRKEDGEETKLYDEEIMPR
jgi:BirA family biotin operon repressor/biotin-[acetyl-CoA-carboxylase] ligase